jgi:hypothetical protein
VVRHWRAGILIIAFAVTVTGCAIPALGPAPSGIPRDGYTLVCEGVGESECQRRADEAATSWPMGGTEPSGIRWITVRPGETEICAAASWGLTYCDWSITIS